MSPQPDDTPKTPDEAVARTQPIIGAALGRTVDLNVSRGFDVCVSVQIVTAATIGAVLDLFCSEAVARGMPLHVAQERVLHSVADVINDQRTRANRKNMN